MDEFCIHDMVPEWCSTCLSHTRGTLLTKEAEATGAPEPEVVTHPFRAQYPGRCELCDNRIESGDLLVAVEMYGETMYVHEDCSR